MALDTLPTIQLVPETLRDRPIFQKVSAMLDFITLTNHYDNVEEMVDRFNIQGDAYDPNIAVEEFGVGEVKRILQAAGTLIPDISLVGLTRMIYRLKGTSRGLVFILRLMGIYATVYEGTRVHREIELQTANGIAWSEDPELSSLNNCEIILGLDTDVGSAVDTLTEQQLLALAREFMWVCSHIIGFKVGIFIRDPVTIQEDVEQQINEDIRQPFRVGKERDLPYPPFDVGGFYIGQGSPRPDPYPYIGGHHKTKPLNSLDGYYDTYVGDDEFTLVGTEVYKSDANSSDTEHEPVADVANKSDFVGDFENEFLLPQPVSTTTPLESDSDTPVITDITEPSRNGRGMLYIGTFYVGSADRPREGAWLGGSNIYAHDYISYEWVD